MIRGFTRPVRPDAMPKLELRAQIHNRFDVEVIDAATGKVRRCARAYNLICDALWARLLRVSSDQWSPQDYFNYILFGSGTTAPAATDTTLTSQIGNVSLFGTTLVSDVASGVCRAQHTITLAASEYVGQTFAEVGVGYDSTHCVTHALLQDMAGNPITITKTAEDVLQITATMFCHFAPGGWSGGSISVAQPGGRKENMFGLLLGVSAGAQGFRLRGAGTHSGVKTTSEPSGNYLTPLAAQKSNTVDAASKKVTAELRLNPGDCNLPIRALFVEVNADTSAGQTNWAPALWLRPGTWFTPTAITAEPVGTGDGAKVGFATAFPVRSGATVYVDGVASAGASVRSGPADVGNLNRWLNRCYLTDAGTAAPFNDGFDWHSASIALTVAAAAESDLIEQSLNGVSVAAITAQRSAAGTSTVVLMASDDLTSWTSTDEITVTGTAADIPIPSSMQAKRYWKLRNTGGAEATFRLLFAGAAADAAHNIVFATPPAAGAVITADYTPDCIAKDSDHVFDLTVDVTFGEYVEV